MGAAGGARGGNEFSKPTAGAQAGCGVCAWVVSFTTHLSGPLCREEDVALFKEQLAGFPLNKPSEMQNHLWDLRNVEGDVSCLATGTDAITECCLLYTVVLEY